MLSVSYPSRSTQNIHTPQQHVDNYHNTYQTLRHQHAAPNNIVDTEYNSLSALNSTVAEGLPLDHMQSDNWAGAIAQYATPRSEHLTTHERKTSLSSIGSTGPTSPFSANTSNPRIAIMDSSSNEIMGEMPIHDNNGHQSGSYYQLAKTMAGPYVGYQNVDTLPEMAYPVTIPGPNSKSRMEQQRGLLPAPELSGASRSYPASVASSVADDSPATPTMNDTTDHVERRRLGRHRDGQDSSTEYHYSRHLAGYGDVPKLGRTLTDVYSDELYSPNFTITSTSPVQPAAPSPTVDLFRQRLSAANSQHLTDAHSPVSSMPKDHRLSPFRTGSPHAPLIHDMRHPMHFNTAQRMREQNKSQQDAQMFQHQSIKPEPETPKTISPKDAILEFHESEGDSNFPLFPPEAGTFDMDQLSKIPLNQPLATQNALGQHQVNYLSSQLSLGVPMAQQYPFVPRHHPSDSPPRLSSAGSSSDSGNSPHIVQRPESTMAAGGTYTCTYHGCTLRFATPALLQKHKREGHRQVQSLGRPSEMVGMTSSLLNSQAGPHRCDRINPSTGKPCNTVFSRPYDLTRHEDTIHNGRKQKVRCDLCTEEKTFSRADALTRHYRVCHPDMELPGKHRRRGGARAIAAKCDGYAVDRSLLVRAPGRGGIDDVA